MDWFHLNSLYCLTMTALEKEIQKLPKLEKVGIMEFIWADLLKEAIGLNAAVEKW